PLPPLLHQAPFRLLDRVLHADLERGQLLATRLLTAGDALWPAEAGLLEPPALPTFPEVLIIEALCQAAACLNGLEPAGPDAAAAGAHLGYLVAVSDFRFQDLCDRPRIGETLLLHVERQGKMGALVSFAARAEAVT